jgi:hypothetical protein
MTVFFIVKTDKILPFGVTVSKKINLMADGKPGPALQEEFGTMMKVLKPLVHGV